jgi:signal transduction histidine kinase
LEGIDRNWSTIMPNPYTENYRDLVPGNYRFRVASKGLNGNWSNPAEFYLTILPPWWRTWWAYALYSLAVGAIAWAFFQMRSKALLRENMILESKVTQRTEQLRKSLENLKEAQSQLVQREKMGSLGELTAGVAHEIQNPLNFVNNFTELNNELLADLKHEIAVGNLSEVQKLAGTIIENGEKITQHGKRADGIVKGMLQHSRTSSGQKETTDINALADEYLRLSYHGLRAKDKSFNAAIETHFDPRIPPIKAIPQDLGRVLLNIYNNAFYSVSERIKKSGSQHVDSGMDNNRYQPRVIVSTNLENNVVTIRIRDNGAGVPPSVREKIFQPFFTTKPAGQGTGLGLSLSYDIITKVHGGSIALNEELEEGAEFIVTLPRG